MNSLRDFCIWYLEQNLKVSGTPTRKDIEAARGSRALAALSLYRRDLGYLLRIYKLEDELQEACELLQQAEAVLRGEFSAVPSRIRDFLARHGKAGTK